MSSRPPKTASNERLLRCLCSTGRNLVVCLDGTSNQFGEKNTNVVALYRCLEKFSKKQLTWYNSGIGTQAKTSWSSLSSLKQALGQAIDQAVALDFEGQILDAYQWLSENYEDGDRIFLFGFSRGAYQVRVLAAMIDKAGLLPKGNSNQIAFAYERYAAVIDVDMKSNTSGEEPIPNKLCAHFKDTFSRNDVRVHFVGVWDTVASIGVTGRLKLPSTQNGMGQVCVFRHALALDERRVKFLPVYADGDKGPSGVNVKEVWFAGNHSDVGGDNYLNLNDKSFGPSLRWMIYEAVHFGLHVKPLGGKWSETAPKPSFPLLWAPLECLPFLHPTYTKAGRRTCTPHLAEPRKAQTGQRIHESVFEYIRQGKYTPRALLPDGDGWSHTLWKGSPRELEDAGILIEDDPYALAKRTLAKLASPPRETSVVSVANPARVAREKPRSVADLESASSTLGENEDVTQGTFPFKVPEDNVLADACINDLATLASTDFGFRALLEIDGIADMLLSALQAEQAGSKPRFKVIAILLKILSRSPPPKRVLRQAERLRRLESTLKGEHLKNLHKVISLCVDPLIAGPIATYDTEILHVALEDRQIIVSSEKEWSKMQLAAQTEKAGNIRVGDVSSVAVSRKGSKIVFAIRTPSPKIAVWDTAEAKTLAETAVLDEVITSVAFSPSAENTVIVSGSSASQEGYLKVWCVAGDDLTLRKEQRVGHPVLVASPVSPYGEHILALLEGGTIMDWKWTTGSLKTRVLQGLKNDSIQSAAFSADGKLVVTSSADNLLRVSDARTGMEVMQPRIGHTNRVAALTFSPDGKLIASGSQDKTIRLWDALSGESLGTLNVNDPVKSVAFSQDSKYVLSGSNNGNIMVWDIHKWLMCSH